MSVASTGIRHPPGDCQNGAASAKVERIAGTFAPRHLPDHVEAAGRGAGARFRRQGPLDLDRQIAGTSLARSCAVHEKAPGEPASTPEGKRPNESGRICLIAYCRESAPIARRKVFRGTILPSA
jgi:hypothetical protein